VLWLLLVGRQRGGIQGCWLQIVTEPYCDRDFGRCPLVVVAKPFPTFFGDVADLAIGESLGEHVCVRDRGTGFMIKIAAINNISQVRWEQTGGGDGCQEAAQGGFQQLMTLVNSSEVSIMNIFTAQELKGMMLNALMASR
jgi:hypothetical protein